MKNLLLLIMALLMGSITSQFPEYSQQYRQRLSGAVTELSNIVERFDQDAAQFGLSRENALQRYLQSDDEFLSLRGKSMNEIVAKYERLRAHLRTLDAAGPFERVIVFAQDRDPTIASDTMNAYEPAVPLTPVGAAFAAAGFFGGWILFALLFSPFGGRRRRREYA